MIDGGPSPPTPLISVVIPTVNSLTTLTRALRSVLAQNYHPFEVVIIDDASVDGSADFARDFPGLSIRVERFDMQSGMAAARNRGIEVSQGEFVAFLAADDEWLPGKIARQLSVLQNDPSLSFVSCEADVTAPDGSFVSAIHPHTPRPEGPDAWKTLLRHPCVATSCVMTRRALLQDVGGFNPELAAGEDQDLWIRLALGGPVHHIHQSLARVHERANNLSKAQHGEAFTSALPMIMAHVERQKHRLSPAEIEEIVVTRHAEIGRTNYETGNIKEGFRLLSTAISHGHRPIETLSYLVSASPPMRAVKRIVGSGPAIPSGIQLAEMATDTPPLLTVVVDTEEEFDWDHPFNPKERGLESINYLPLAQQLHENYGVVPTYVVDYPIVDDDNGVAILKNCISGGRALIGAHLQPWVNPPFGEAEEFVNTYPGNLPFALEYNKLARLTEMLQAKFGVRPMVYKAGRYGLGPATARILKSLGYEIDVSVLPYTNLGHFGGPDFSFFPNVPFWFGEGLELFEVPMSRGFTGVFRKLGPLLPFLMDHPVAKRLHLIGAWTKLGLLERITLTPEGISFDEHKRLTYALLKQGCKVFSFTYHSSSLMPGGTQYVPTRGARDAFLERMDRYFEFFTKEIGGRPATLPQIRDLYTRPILAGHDKVDLSSGPQRVAASRDEATDRA